MWVLFIIVIILMIVGVIYLNTKQNGNTSNLSQNSNRGDGSTPVKLSNYSYDIVGEQSYQNNIAKIAGKKEENAKRFECFAKVTSEPTNRYDKNAVKVEINGLLVGYLSKDEAIKLKGKSINKMVPALINGGWDNDESEGSYGVKLAINTTRDLF